MYQVPGATCQVRRAKCRRHSHGACVCVGGDPRNVPGATCRYGEAAPTSCSLSAAPAARPSLVFEVWCLVLVSSFSRVAPRQIPQRIVDVVFHQRVALARKAVVLDRLDMVAHRCQQRRGPGRIPAAQRRYRVAQQSIEIAGRGVFDPALGRGAKRIGRQRVEEVAEVEGGGWVAGADGGKGVLVGGPNQRVKLYSESSTRTFILKRDILERTGETSNYGRDPVG